MRNFLAKGKEREEGEGGEIDGNSIPNASEGRNGGGGGEGPIRRNREKENAALIVQ